MIPCLHGTCCTLGEVLPGCVVTVCLFDYVRCGAFDDCVGIDDGYIVAVWVTVACCYDYVRYTCSLCAFVVDVFSALGLGEGLCFVIGND